MRVVVLAILVEVLREFAEGFKAFYEWFIGPGEPRESVVKDDKGRQSDSGNETSNILILSLWYLWSLNSIIAEFLMEFFKCFHFTVDKTLHAKPEQPRNIFPYPRPDS